MYEIIFKLGYKPSNVNKVFVLGILFVWGVDNFML